MFGRADAVGFDHDPESYGATGGAETVPNSGAKAVDPAADRTADLARCFYVSPICPITRSTASTDTKQPFGAKPARSCLLSMPWIVASQEKPAFQRWQPERNSIHRQ